MHGGDKTRRVADDASRKSNTEADVGGGAKTVRRIGGPFRGGKRAGEGVVKMDKPGGERAAPGGKQVGDRAGKGNARAGSGGAKAAGSGGVRRRGGDEPRAAVAPDATAYERERDRKLYIEALQARRRGEKPSKEQLAAWKRYDKREEHERRWRYYRTVPKRDYIELSGGRSTKTLHEQADRYELPLRGRLVDLQAVITGFHNLLARYANRLGAGSDGDDPLLAGVNSPALERYREERAKLARLDRLEREGSLVERAALQELLAPLAAMLRAAGENLERQFGIEAAQLLNDVLDDFERDVVEWMRDETVAES